jgi:integrase
MGVGLVYQAHIHPGPDEFVLSSSAHNGETSASVKGQAPREAGAGDQHPAVCQSLLWRLAYQFNLILTHSSGVSGRRNFCMSTHSILNQVAHALDVLRWDKEQIDKYKAEHNVRSVKKALRPDGDPTKGLPAILSRRTRDCYLETATPFFDRARMLSGKKLLGELLTEDIITKTLDTYYKDHMPSTLDTILAAIGKVHMGCRRLRWTKLPSPITPQLREHVKAYRDDGDVHQPRFGYEEADAVRIVGHLKESGSSFSLPAELALACGLRLSEIAGLKGKDVDKENGMLHIVGKGGKHRDVPLPAEIAGQLDTSLPYIFRPTPSWKQAFYQAVRRAASALGISISGVHRLRANYAQQVHEALLETGKSDREARREVSRRLGHNRVEVTNSYIPPILKKSG